MEPTRLTRKEVIRRGAAVSIFVAVGGLEGVPEASAALDAGQPGDVSAGVFSKALDTRTAFVTLTGVGPMRVALASDAYVNHGTDGAGADLTRFVPGERVAMRGKIVDGTLNAVEFQSVYTEEIGSLQLASGDGETLQTAGGGTLAAPGGSVEVPPSIQSASGDRPVLHSGESAAATIWTDPATGRRTAVLMSPRS